MKKIIILFIILFFAFSLFSKPVTEQKTKTLLNNFLQYHNKSNYKIISQKKLTAKNKQTLAYIYQLSPDGFVAISSDDEIEPIIAYSFRNNLVTNNDNLIYDMISRDISLRLSYAPKSMKLKALKEWNSLLSFSKDLRDFQQWPAPGCTQTDGWVETTWNQTGVFNRFCPLDGPYNRSVVGCVATALSMILDYHHYIGGAQFSDSDDYTSGWDDQMHIDDDYIERDYPSFPQLNEYLTTLDNHYQNNIPLTNDDKSALCFAAGIATHMIYGANASGTWVSEVQTALINKFGYISANYEDNINAEFYQNLADNMKAMKPAELAIYTSNWNNGHAIICDGYNTDNYFHLNYGWGTSNNTCWYSLPEGMPYNYSILANAVIDIEGGEIPTHLIGTVNIPEGSPVNTYVKFESDSKIYEAFVSSSNGSFDIPAIEEGTYTITAIKEGETLYYTQTETDVSGTTQTITLNLASYEALTVNINSPVNPNGTHIRILKNGELAYSGICQNDNGNLSIPNVLPGEYTAIASLNENYFSTQTFEVTATNQSLSINLTFYQNDLWGGFHNFSQNKWHLLENYTISCGIKITSSDFPEYQNTPLAKIRFLSPISSEEGEIAIQLWQSNTLLEEKEISNFEEGEWISASFDDFIILNPDKEYFLGYKINSGTGFIAYCDNGPQIHGKGAYFHTTSWNPVPSTTLDANFCIEAVFISQNSTSISGNVSTTDNYPNLENTVIKAGNFISYANPNGEYLLNLTHGVYDITALLENHNPATIQNITINQNQVLENINFVLDNTQQNTDTNVIQPKENFINAYPNPFNVSKSSKSTITFEIKGKCENPKVTIYNLKGQLVKSISDFKNNKAVWNPLNEKNLGSGVYFYKLQNSNANIKKLLIIK